jgi:hypothetical protein
MAFKPGTTTLDRADEEPTTGAAGQTTRSVAEILYTPDSGIQAFSEPGDQTAPRLCVGGDALLLTYQSKAGGPSGLCWRLWR